MLENYCRVVTPCLQEELLLFLRIPSAENRRGFPLLDIIRGVGEEEGIGGLETWKRTACVKGVFPTCPQEFNRLSILKVWVIFLQHLFQPPAIGSFYFFL
jgi:hypothetical protein